MYTSYVESSCNGITPELNANDEVIRGLALKLWKKIVKDNVDFDEEELRLMKELGINI
ncbi:hypothetical protein MetMK1DRAFT_00008910 [Metallosphaera yellowstonensis MK1]|uniref:Uncharacterized protein n=1 Tax=Metallosphaera yellowstonensis MK1 TaxID=671065 RepID=H2C2B8_9CREN|nr:hypothetical protein MetMK1DRAFT_00008910 [Metallosphaera yellowstonensis MK1]